MSASPTSYSSDMEGGSPTPNMGTTTPLTHNSDPNDKRIFIRPIGIKALEPYDGHRKIIESITRYFPEAFKTFRSAPQSMRDIWFNEYKKSCKWNPEDEATIRKIYEKSAAKRLSDTLSQVRANLREGKSPPKWMSDAVLAQYQTLWDNADFKRLSEKNKKNRNSDCGGLNKGGYVFGFGSDTQHYFPEVATQKKSTYGGSSSHVACDERIGQLEKTKDEILEQNKIIIELLRRAHPELLQSITHAVDSNQGSDIGLDNLNVNDDTQSPV
nr:putative transposase En/Spm [Ipomoea batatas]